MESGGSDRDRCFLKGAVSVSSGLVLLLMDLFLERTGFILFGSQAVVPAKL